MEYILGEATALTPSELEEKTLKKHTAAIRTYSDTSLLQDKLWDVLLLNAYGKDFLEKIRKRELFGIPFYVLGEILNNRDYPYLAKSAKGLQRVTIEWDVGGGAELQGQWLKNEDSYQMIGVIRVRDGVLWYDYPMGLAERLYEPEVYEDIMIKIQNNFKTKSGRALHQNILPHLKEGSTGLNTIDYWKKILGSYGKKTYEKFYAFNGKVLKKAIQEVKDVTKVELELITERKGRKVVLMGFDIKKKESSTIKSMEDLENSFEYQSLVSLGVHKVHAIQWIQSYGTEYIKEKIDLFDFQNKKKAITNSGGWIRKAIENNYINPQAIKEKEKLNSNINKEVAEAKKYAEDEVKRALVTEFLDRCDENKTTGLIQEFEDSKIFDLKIRKDMFFSKHYKSVGINDTGIKFYFREFIYNEILKESEEFSHRIEKARKEAEKMIQDKYKQN